MESTVGSRKSLRRLKPASVNFCYLDSDVSAEGHTVCISRNNPTPCYNIAWTPDNGGRRQGLVRRAPGVRLRYLKSTHPISFLELLENSIGGGG
jgi:hypothetical protein